jgi:hypothetical protein
MPRYFFDIRDGNELHRDEEGLDFPDLATAEREAAEAAACILRDSTRQNSSLTKVTIEVRDEHQRCIAAASAFVEVERRTG